MKSTFHGGKSMFSLSSLARPSHQTSVSALSHTARPSMASAFKPIQAPQLALGQPQSILRSSVQSRGVQLQAISNDQQPVSNVKPLLGEEEVVMAEFADSPEEAVSSESEQDAPAESDAQKEPNLVLTKEAGDILKGHFDAWKQELTQLKDEQVSRIKQKGNQDFDKTWDLVENAQEKVDQTKSWLDTITETASTTAPAFLKPKTDVNMAMLSAFQTAILDVADQLTLENDEKPKMFVVNGKDSKLWSMAESASDEAVVAASPRGMKHDVVVLDNLLDLSLSDMNQKIDLAAQSMKDDGFVIMVNAFNPDRGHLNLQKHASTFLKGQLQSPLNQAVQQRLESKNLSVVKSTDDQGVRTVILQRAKPLATQLQDATRKAVDQSVDSAKSFLDRFSSKNPESTEGEGVNKSE